MSPTTTTALLYIGLYFVLTIGTLLVMRALQHQFGNPQPLTEPPQGTTTTADHEASSGDENQIPCPICGTVNEADPVYQFCAECGNPLPDANSTGTTPAPAPP